MGSLGSDLMLGFCWVLALIIKDLTTLRDILRKKIVLSDASDTYASPVGASSSTSFKPKPFG